MVNLLRMLKCKVSWATFETNALLEYGYTAVVFRVARDPGIYVRPGLKSRGLKFADWGTKH